MRFFTGCSVKGKIIFVSI